MFLEGIEFETIWKVGLKWADQKPDISEVEKLSPFAKARMQMITRAIILKKLPLRDVNNLPVLDSNIIINLIFSRKLFWPIRDTYFKDKLDKNLLDSYYVSRSDVLRWCESEKRALPAFWSEENLLSALPELQERKPSKRDLDKAACQALAKAFWEIDPRITPSHMANSHALREIGNSKDYKDAKTVKGWIAELDPLKDTRQMMGRPKDVQYYLNLKSGGLNPKGITTFGKK